MKQTMKQILFFALLLFTPLSLLGAPLGKITASALAVRKGPSTTYRSLAYVSRGTRVKVLEKKGDWFKIQYGSTIGWASGKYIRLQSESPSSEPTTGRTTASKLTVRSQPTLRGPKVTSLSRGTKIKIINKRGNWYRIQLGNSTGWVSGKYVQVLSSEENGTPASVALSNNRTATKLGLFKTTFYWMIDEKNFPGPKTKALYDEKRNLIGYFSKKFAKHLFLEGTGKLADGRILNYIGRGRFKVITNAPYGLGARNKKLIPYRSLAVDPKKIPIGTVIYIPQAKGMKLPDGTVHDGIFYAHDVGGGIKGNHIDVYTGVGDNRKFFEKMGMKNLKYIQIYKVQKSSIIERLGGM